MQSLSRVCRVPVLVLHQDGTALDSAFPDPLRPLRSIVAQVALAGSQFAEAAIQPAASLVAALASPVQGTLVLTRVVPLSGLGRSPEARKEVGDALIRSAEQGDVGEGTRLTGRCSLIAITTHRCGGLQHLALGSVTERVLGASRLPLLVCMRQCMPMHRARAWVSMKG